MKLSDIVEFRNQLDKFDMSRAKIQMIKEIENIKHTIDTTEPHFDDLAEELSNTFGKVSKSIDSFGAGLNKIRQRLQDTIQSVETDLLKKSVDLYREGLNDSCEYILSRQPEITDDQREFIRGRINAHADWKKVGLIIRPGNEEWVRQMVALDPLYIVDTHPELLTPAMKKFNRTYQSRLRSYVVNERSPRPILFSLPKYQFGAVLVYNFFNYKSIDIVERYLTELYGIMERGGKLMMTINDCDRSHGVRNAENNFCCYTTRSRVLDIAGSLGYETVRIDFLDGANTWIELKKPGERRSTRGGQVLVQIKSKVEKQ